MQSSGFLLLRVRAWEPPFHILQFHFRLTTFHMLMSFNHKTWPYCVHLKNIPFKTKVLKSLNYMYLPHIISLCYYHAVVCEVKLLSRVLLCNPMDCSLPGSSLHGILQARILEWVAISFSRGSSRPRDRTRVSCIAGRRFNWNMSFLQPLF